jgi:hypothetical protein
MYSLAMSGESLIVPRPAAHEEVAFRRCLHSFPLEEHRLGAPLAADRAQGPALHDLSFGVDAGPRPVPETVLHDLRQVAHELVVVFETIALDADDRAVVGDADQEVAAIGVEDFGFSATPKPKTLELFGTRRADGKFAPFHLYSMRQAIEEGFILDVLANYSTYKAYWRLLKPIGGY